MPRPRKWRNVCCMPQSNLYGPLNIENNKEDFIIMSIEEYETIRLIDLEGCVQEQAAEQMNIARTTVQRIYNDARKKLAESIVHCKVLKIEGGDYKLCDGLGNNCRSGACCRYGHRNENSSHNNNGG